MPRRPDWRSSSSSLASLPKWPAEPRKVTSISTGAAQAVWSPDGRALAFVSGVFPEFSGKPFKESDKLNKEKQGGRYSYHA